MRHVWDELSWISFPEVKFKMASEILRVDNQETLEALQREADELKKKLEDEKAKLKDVESNDAICSDLNLRISLFTVCFEL